MEGRTNLAATGSGGANNSIVPITNKFPKLVCAYPLDSGGFRGSMINNLAGFDFSTRRTWNFEFLQTALKYGGDDND